MPLDQNKQLLAMGDTVTHEGNRFIVAALGYGNIGLNLVLQEDGVVVPHTFAVHSGETIKESGVSPANNHNP